jgi:outer membrane protein OmpA-like peptidoglycan-associated protein
VELAAASPEVVSAGTAEPADQTALEDVDAERSQIDAALAESTARIDDLTATLAERDAALEAITAAVERAEAAVETLTATVGERDGTIAELTASLGERDATIEELRNRLSFLQDEPDAKAELVSLVTPGTAGDQPGLPQTVSTEPATLASGIALFEQELAAAKAEPDAPPPVPADRPLTEVHFESASAKLTPGGEERAIAAARALAAMNLDKIRIAGHTDRVGNPEANRRLSEARAEAVAKVLIDAGLPRERIEIASMGETPDVAPVATPDGVSEPLNRCVGIYPVAPTTAVN